MSNIDMNDLDQVFEYHPPDEAQRAAYAAIRAAAKDFARAIIQNAPSSADRSAAIRLLRQSVHMANAAVALKGAY